jgi:hypothetical protein
VETRQPDIVGAAVYVDNKLVGKIPVKTLSVPSGNHRIRIMKEMYAVYNAEFSISDEETKVLTPVLQADFAEVTLKTDSDADIYVNSEKKGSGAWKGRLATGAYIFETRKPGHINSSTEYEISAANSGDIIQLQGPTPIY